MVEDTYCTISKTLRIDSRFYLIEINERFYLVDYSNPKDFRNYFVPFFPETMSSWIAYDVTQDKEVFTESKVWKGFKTFKQTIFCFFLFFVINSLLFPQDLRLTRWTTDSELIKNGLPILLYIILGIFAMICILIHLESGVKNLQRYPVLTLQINTKTEKNKITSVLKGIILSLVSYPTLLAIGIGGNNYIQLLLFGFIGIYSLVFIKFIEFKPSVERNKIYLKEA